MSSCRKQILGKLAPTVARLNLVTDPDRLFLKGILTGTREPGTTVYWGIPRVVYRWQKMAIKLKQGI